MFGLHMIVQSDFGCIWMITSSAFKSVSTMFIFHMPFSEPWISKFSITYGTYSLKILFFCLNFIFQYTMIGWMDNFYSDSIKSTNSSTNYEQWVFRTLLDARTTSPVVLPTGQTMGQLESLLLETPIKKEKKTHRRTQNSCSL